MIEFKFYKTRDVKNPNRGSAESAGIDFFIPNDFNSGIEYIIAPQTDVLIPSGIKISIPKSTALIFHDKSGVATKRKLTVLAKVVDSDYEGEIHIHLMNVGDVSQTISPGDKIIQGILTPIILSDIIEETDLSKMYERKSERGEGGFGSTGIK